MRQIGRRTSRRGTPRQAAGWPHLVQLVAATAVDLCNRDGRKQADEPLLEEARQPPPESDALRLVLKRHLLVEPSPDGPWQLRVPLMARWLRERT